MARTLILMVNLWERRQPVSGAQTHMSCTALLNLTLIVMIRAIPHTTYCSLLLGTTCLYTVVYKSNQVDRIYISITMGKVNGCRLWSPSLLTGGRVYPDYPCPHMCKYLQEGLHPSLIVQEHRLSIAPRIVEAIPPPNKGERHSIP